MDSIPLLGDADVDRLVSMAEAVEAVEQALARKGASAFLSPPRHYFATSHGALVFTIGGDGDQGVAGFRVYGMFPGASEHDQLVVVYDATTGRLRGLVKGSRVGAMRTGALGGVAVKYGARRDAKTLAIIGSGRQARTQLEAAAVVRDLSEVRVYSRSEPKREAFATEMAALLNLNVEPATSAEKAIASADIVIVATNSRVPVFDVALIEPGTHVTTIRLGQGQSELDPAVADRASAVFTDSMAQVQNYPGGFFLAHRLDSISDLSEHVARGMPVRESDTEITLYLSAGLAGTEVVVADLALQRAGAGG